MEGMSLPKFDWYQDEKTVTISILKQGTNVVDCTFSYDSDDHRLIVKCKDELIFESKLHDEIDFSKTTLKCTRSRIEVKIRKSHAKPWASITPTEGPAPIMFKASTEKPIELKPKKERNWDAIEKEVLAEEENDSKDDINHLFQKIYASSNDDTKKAMIKSFSESNGTVLSTNWDEVKKGKVETKPPEDMEFVKYPT
uniref:Suppressor of G2 allele of SKP1 homolog (inferred by orthology to a human protein) n=1 Tax=Strongyloides venezuelensis TaxID=75913 RepID=A0A0K0FYB2_STRVS